MKRNQLSKYPQSKCHRRNTVRLLNGDLDLEKEKKKKKKYRAD